MIRPGRERLAGTVEVDESYLGGAEEGVRDRQTEDKALIVATAAICYPRRARMRRKKACNGPGDCATDQAASTSMARA